MDFQEFIQDKANKLVSLGWPDDMILSFIDGAEQVKNYFGWHPASEKPIIPKDKEDIWVYCLVYGEDKDEKVLAPMFLRYTKLLTLGWVLPDDMIVVWWCYPPKEE
jgi:hypothetical protein